MNRSFISFTYGGKAIEDFNLIATIDGDRLSKQLYASFEDLTTQNDVMDGQYYWGTHFNANSLSFKLATDEITQIQLDNFKQWFKPGIERELILAEHPNRAIMARISEPPNMEMVPFEKQVTYKLNNLNYNTSTTVYRGEITLTFIMDEPAWYAKINYMPTYINKITLKEVENITKENDVESLNDPDMIKIMLEDNIPHQSILRKNLFLGGNHLVQTEARVGEAEVEVTRIGIVTIESEGLELYENSPIYFFYSGNAKSYPILKFSFKPIIASTSNYIYYPRNNISSTNYPFSTIRIKNTNNTTVKTFKYTTPSIFTGYNQAMTIFWHADDGYTVVDIINQLTEKVTEKYSRAWAIGCVKAINKNGILTVEDRKNLFTNMKKFIFEENETETGWVANNDVTITVNSKTGEATGKFYVKVLGVKDTIDTVNTFTLVEENVGDMILSDYLTIEEQNHLTNEGTLVDLYDSLNGTCYSLVSDKDLTNVLFLYDNMYL